METLVKERIELIKECFCDGKVFKHLGRCIPKKYRFTNGVDGMYDFCRNNAEHFKDIVFKRRK